MKKIFLICTVMAIFATTSAQTKSPFSSLSIGVGASTYGLKLEVATPIANSLTLRGGFSTLPTDVPYKTSISAAEYRKYINYDPEVSTNTNIKFSNANIFLDYSPVKNGIFHITAGVFIGSNKIKFHGDLLNPNTQKSVIHDLKNSGYTSKDLPTIEFDGKYVLRPLDDGSMSGEIVMGNSIKPYFGIGLGSTIPNKRVGVKFEVGVIHQGELNVTSPNMIKGDFNGWLNSMDEYKKYKPYLSWFPMINLQISYKIF